MLNVTRDIIFQISDTFLRIFAAVKLWCLLRLI